MASPSQRALQAYRVLLRAYPEDYRRRFADEMCADFAEHLDRLRRRRWTAMASLWAQTSFDVLRLALLEHAEARARGREPDPTRGIRRRRVLPSRDARGGRPPGRRGTNPVEQIVGDLRFALRGLRRRPMFSVSAIATLALGIGGGATAFSVVHAVLFEPLPYHEPDRLVRLWEVPPGMDRMPIAPANLIDWREESESFTDVAAIDWTSLNLTDGSEPARVTAQRVSESFFDVLGVSPAIGRGFTPSDGTPTALDVAVLGDGLWRNSFAGDPGIVGRSVRLDDRPFTVIGVMPPDFVFHNPDGAPASLWVPGAITSQTSNERQRRSLQAVARLKDGVTVEQARAEMDALASSLAETHPRANRNFRTGEAFGAAVRPFREDLVAAVRPSMLVLSGAVGFVLLIAWVNVTNLLLVRATSRRRELALRVSIGAGARRIGQQLLTETFVLSVLGGLAGLAFARVLLTVFVATAPDAGDPLGLSTGAIPLLSRAHIDGWVLAMTALTCLVTTVTCGLAPAVQAASSDPLIGLRSGSGSARRRGVAGSILVASEISLALVLLIGLGLLVQSMSNLSRIPLGFEPRGAEVMRVKLTRDRYATPAGEPGAPGRLWRLRPEHGRLVDDVVGRLSEIPGVEVAGATNRMPLHGPFSTNPSTGINIEGIDRDPTGVVEGIPAYMAFVLSATPGYFDAMGIPIVQGRGFREDDRPGTPTVAIVNPGLSSFYGVRDPVGRVMKVRDGPWRDTEIVGLTGSFLWFGYYHDFLQREWYDFSIAYLPYGQPPVTYRTGGVDFQMEVNFVVRHDGDAEGVRRAMREVFRQADPETPVVWIGSLEEYVAAGISDRRFHMLVLTVIGFVALVMALVGVHGVIAFQVGQRIPEIGVRLALGANASGVVRMIVAQGTRLTILGIVSGIAVAMAATRFLAQWLHEISPTEPSVFLGLSAAMAAMALMACWIPARRAARVDPLESLRSE